MNNKPSTPLPWKRLPYIDAKRLPEEIPIDDAYELHAANAYPRLVAALQQADDLVPRISADDPMAPALADWLRDARVILRELGEL